MRIHDGQITAVGPAVKLSAQQGENIIDLGEAVLSPGLINAHCHLDYTHFKGGLLFNGSFAEWIKNINAMKRTFSTEDYVDAIQDGFRQLIRSGTTTVCNIEAFPELLNILPPPPIRTWWFLELIDLRQRLGDEETMMGALQFFDEHPDWLGGFGLSPHAPYTASIELYRLARRCSELHQMPFTTHIAESLEEQEMFLYAKGALHDFLRQLGRDNSDCGQGSALSHLLEQGALNTNCLAVHLNYLQDYDWPALVQSGASVVHCPKCHTYFGHRRFPLEEMRRNGINLCLGTDSLASNNTLDLRSEIREAQSHFPEVPAHEWFKMVTVNPAKVLQQEGRLGVIAPGACADLIAFPLASGQDPYLAIIQSRSRPDLVMVQGQRLL